MKSIELPICNILSEVPRGLLAISAVPEIVVMTAPWAKPERLARAKAAARNLLSSEGIFTGLFLYRNLLLEQEYLISNLLIFSLIGKLSLVSDCEDLTAT